MSFGLRDEDWVDPPDEVRESDCSACLLGSGASPCGHYVYCLSYSDWVAEQDWRDECPMFEGELMPKTERSI